MKEGLEQYLFIFGRMITVMPWFLFWVFRMGKRSVAEVPVFDFLVLITLGSIVGADIYNRNVSHWQILFEVGMLAVFQMVFSRMVIHSRWFGRLVTFEPTVVVRDGKFLVGNMRRIRYSMDSVLLMLRQRDVFNVADVEVAIVEANGELTVHKKAGKATVTIEDLGIEKVSGGLAIPVVVEGRVYSRALKMMDLSEQWLLERLREQGTDDVEQVFYAAVNERHQLHVSLVGEKGSDLPPLLH